MTRDEILEMYDTKMTFAEFTEVLRNAGYVGIIKPGNKIVNLDSPYPMYEVIMTGKYELI